MFSLVSKTCRCRLCFFVSVQIFLNNLYIRIQLRIYFQDRLIMTNILTEPTETHGMLRPNTKRAKNAIMGLKCVLIIEFVAIFFLYLEYSLLSSVSSKPTSEEAINASYDQQQFFWVIYVGVYIVSTITFLKWFRRAYYNLGIRVSPLSSSNIRAAISWFIPIVSIYKPYQILKEMYQKTNYLL